MDHDLGFARDIRPLFSDRDAGSMSSRFDLSSTTRYAPTPN
jgi:hypothetical protein